MTVESAFSSWSTHSLTGHKRKIYSLGWSASGARLASGSQDQSLRVWTAEPGSCNRFERPEAELKGHTGAVVSLGWSPADEQLLASVGGEVRLWDVRGSAKAAEPIACPGQSMVVTWRPDGKQFAVANRENEVSVVDVGSRAVVRGEKFGHEVYDVVWSACGRYLFVTTEKGTVEVRSQPEMELIRVLRSHNWVCRCAALDRTGRLLATGGADSLVCMWDTESLNCFRTYYDSDCPIRSLGFSADAKYLAFSTEDAWVDVVAVGDGSHAHMLECKSISEGVAWHPREAALAYADEDESKGIATVCIFAPGQG